MYERELIAKNYFDAFHAGRIEEILSYFAEHCTVRYGKEPEKKARDFFLETKNIIATVKLK